MRDTAEVLSKLNLEASTSNFWLSLPILEVQNKLLLLVKFIIYGYPFSVSEVFQKRNTNRTIENS